MKQQGYQVVLAIYPSSRGFGYCLFEAPDKLLDYGVKTVRNADSEKALNWSTKMMDYFEPQVVVLRTVIDGGSKGKRIARLVAEMKKAAKSNKLDVSQYDRMQIKNCKFRSKVSHPFRSKVSHLRG